MCPVPITIWNYEGGTDPFIIIGLLSIQLAGAQLNCVTTEYSRLQISRDPVQAQNIQNAENFIRQVRQSGTTDRFENGILKIPVVIHNLYHTDQKITDEQVAAQLDVLNKTFRRQNANTIKRKSLLYLSRWLLIVKSNFTWQHQIRCVVPLPE